MLEKALRSLFFGFAQNFDHYIIGSLSQIKNTAVLNGLDAAGVAPYVTNFEAPSHGRNEQPFGRDDILKCASIRANSCLSLVMRGGRFAKYFNTYAIGIQSGITYDNFNDSKKGGSYAGFEDGSWEDATFYDRTAIVIQDMPPKDKHGKPLRKPDRIVVWTTAMEWPDNEFIRLSAVGGTITNLQGETETIKGGFQETVSSIMIRTRGDDGPKLTNSKDPNTSFDRYGRTREAVIAEAIELAVRKMHEAKINRTGDVPINLSFEIDYTSNDHNDLGTRVTEITPSG